MVYMYIRSIPQPLTGRRSMPKNSVVNLDDLRAKCKSCSLYQLCLPLGLEEGDIDKLESIVKRRRVIDKGSYLYHSGDQLKSLYAVRSGSFKSYVPVADSAEQVVGFHLPGELMGMDAIHGEEHRSYSKALETSSVCEIPFEKLESLSVEIPGLNHHLMSLMSEELQHEQCHVTQLAKMTAEARLANFVIEMSRRHTARGHSKTEFNLSMSRNDIANLLGLAVETVSRLFTHFQELKILQVERKHIQILDMHGLQNQAQACANENKSNSSDTSSANIQF